MKKIMMLLMVVLMLGALVSCASSADKFDSENYIGAAKVSLIMKMTVGVSREEMSQFEIDGEMAFMNGLISKDTIRQVKKLISDYPEVTTIVMQDVGGSVDDISNLEASRLVREAGLNTKVLADGHVASGGTDFFCAGVIRTAEEGAKVGVHSWAGDGVENAALLPKDHKEHQKYIDYYDEMDMPDPSGFYFFTINAATADGMHYMTQEEMLEYGLIE